MVSVVASAVDVTASVIVPASSSDAVVADASNPWVFTVVSVGAASVAAEEVLAWVAAAVSPTLDISVVSMEGNVTSSEVAVEAEYISLRVVVVSYGRAELLVPVAASSEIASVWVTVSVSISKTDEETRDEETVCVKLSLILESEVG